jgi:hypothetical protein
MQRFAKNYINKAYSDSFCYKCNRGMDSNNTTLKSIILGKKEYGSAICDLCSKGESVFVVRKSLEEEPEEADDNSQDMDTMEASIGSEGTPSTVFTVRGSQRVNTAKQNKTAVKPFKKRKFLQG